MTSKIFCLNITKSQKMFWQTVKKNLGITILMCIAVLLYCPGLFLVRMDEFHDGIRYYADSVLTDFVPIIAVFSCIAVVVFNIINFSFLYSKRSSDVFHAFPLKRSELLLSRFFAGFISTAIPVVLGYIAVPFIAFCFPLQSFWGAVGMAANCLVLTLIAMLLFSAVSLIFIVCSGSVIDFLISFLGVNGAVLLVGLISNNMLCNTLTGFSSYNVTQVLKTVSPLYYCANSIGEYLVQDMKVGAFPEFRYCFICGAICIAAIIVSVYLYKHRKAEMGGQGYAYRFIYILCSVLVSVVMAYAMGVLFSSDSQKSPIFWIFAFIGAMVSATVLGAVTDRGFKTVKKSLVIGAGSAFVLFVFFLSIRIISPAYLSAMPDAEKINAVYVGYQDEEIAFATDDALSIHKSLVEKGAIKKVDEQHNYEEKYQTVRFIYSLSSGLKFEREFQIANSKAQDELERIVFGAEREKMVYERLEQSRAGTLNLWSSVEDINVYITRYQMKKLFEIYFAEARSDSTFYTFSSYEQRPIDVNWEVTDDYMNAYYYLYANDSFEETYAYVKSFSELSKMQNDQ